ncbi:OX-2 membrane glycoprotein-like [Triplophysa rosa]|uniref:OX-2 membrane glycoprotein-like n=1 Tax=Triplophysa rosa TaxID=992332 RepID=UPI0025460ED4|nr:OX-2 membrane glycoprotein-like [Triplophysa rosa]
MLRLMIIFILLRRVCLSDIILNGETNVLFGHNASLSCALSNPSGVKQVSWERLRAGDDAETLATFSERYKDYVHQEYVGKVTITASLKSSSIVIKNVTFEDEACYMCSFKVYPSGPKRKTFCLTVKGISEITASVNSSSSDSDVTVSCSATGKPTPILQWKSTEKDQNFSASKILTKLNSDGSNTTTSVLKLPLSQFHGKHVECVATSDDVEERSQVSLLDEDRNKNEEEKSVTLRYYTITISLLLIVSIVVIFLYVRLKDNAECTRFASTA